MISDTVLKLIIGLGLAIFIALGISSWLKKRDKAINDAAIAAQSQRTGQATVAIAGKAEVAQEEAAVVESAVAAQRVEIIHKYEAIRNENPSVRAYTDRPLPDELRAIARERRLARDGLGGDEDGGKRDDGAARGDR